MSDQERKESKQCSNSAPLPILAIDFGQKRIGLAISDSNGIVGSPLTTIIRGRHSTYDQSIREIVEIVEQNRVKSILIGMPHAFVEGHKVIQDKIINFGNLLSKSLDIDIYYYDESYSSAEAKLHLINNQLKSTTRDGKVDRISASLFLQKYLNEKYSDNS